MKYKEKITKWILSKFRTATFQKKPTKIQKKFHKRQHKGKPYFPDLQYKH